MHFCSQTIVTSLLYTVCFANPLFRWKRQRYVESSVQIFTSHQGIDRSSNLSISGFNNDPSSSIVWPVQVGTAQGQCYDAFGGLRENKEQWTDGYFKYECRDGHRNPIACIASRRGNLQEITANNEVVVNGFWHKCSGNETYLHYSEEPSCIANGKEIHYSETFRQGTFEMRCEKWGYEVVGCYYLSEEGKSDKMAVGESNIVGTKRYNCQKVRNGTVRFFTEDTSTQTPIDASTRAPSHEADAIPAATDQPSLTTKRTGRTWFGGTALQMQCGMMGKWYNPGDIWTWNQFKMKCTREKGAILLACIASDGTEMPVGETQVVNGVQRECVPRNGWVDYVEYQHNATNIQYLP